MTEPDPAQAASEVEPIRLQRIQAFLKLHLLLCGIMVVFFIIETTFVGAENALTYGLAIGIPATLVLSSMWLLRRRKLIEWIIPGILVIDMILVTMEVFIENGMESGWAATPVLLVTMLPLFSQKRSHVWVLASLMCVLYIGIFVARGGGAISYAERQIGSWAFQGYTGLGWVFFIIGSAILAGRTSLDVLNSQQQLQEEVDRATKALREAQAQLVQQEKMVSLGQLTAGVTHEINNPLTFVRTNVTNMERDVSDVLDMLEAYESMDDKLEQLDPDTLDRIEDLRDALCIENPRAAFEELMRDTLAGIDRVQHIIRDLKTFARLEDTERRAVDVREGIETTLKMLRPQLANGLEVSCEYEDVPVVEAFPALLNQVFMNLLQNAIEAAPDHAGTVKVRTRIDGDNGVVEVVDNGPGVPEELRGRIFDPFFTTKEVGGGTGLGLSLSYRVVERHGGRIEVDDAPGGTGALFRVVLPLAS